MKFKKFGKTLLMRALSSAIVFSLSSCVQSYTVGFLYVTGTVTQRHRETASSAVSKSITIPAN